MNLLHGINTATHSTSYLYFTIHRSEPAEYVQFKMTIVVRFGK